MAYFIYIIQSEKDGSFYKGYTEDYLKRIKQHNNGESTYTSRKLPWILVYLEILPSKRDALIREKNLKKASIQRILALIHSDKNYLLKK
jgi:putative endonuclease